MTSIQEIARQAAWKADAQHATSEQELPDAMADAVASAVGEVWARFRPQHAEDCQLRTGTYYANPEPDRCTCGLLTLLASVERSGRQQVEEKKEDRGGTGLTEGASVSVSVHAPELPHDAPQCCMCEYVFNDDDVIRVVEMKLVCEDCYDDLPGPDVEGTPPRCRDAHFDGYTTVHCTRPTGHYGDHQHGSLYGIKEWPKAASSSSSDALIQEEKKNVLRAPTTEPSTVADQRGHQQADSRQEKT